MIALLNCQVVFIRLPVFNEVIQALDLMTLGLPWCQSISPKISRNKLNNVLCIFQECGWTKDPGVPLVDQEDQWTDHSVDLAPWKANWSLHLAGSLTEETTILTSKLTTKYILWINL